jgi:ORF6N domain
MAKAKTDSLIPIERAASRIYLIRGMKVMFDFDLAELYAVETKALNQAVSRNLERFPPDFMFTLTHQEVTNLRSQFVTSNWGGRRYLPRVFTQEGVAMLSGILHGKRAVEVNVSIMRAFVRLRELVATNEELARKVTLHYRQIAVLFEHVKNMLAPVPLKKNPIGFIHHKD